MRWILITFILMPMLSIGQGALPAAEEDSLLSVWEDEAKSDSVRYFAIKHLCWHGYMFVKPDTAEIMTETMAEFARSKGELVFVADALNLQGITHAIRGDNNQAIEVYKKALEIYLDLGRSDRVAAVYDNIGINYAEQGLYEKAIEYSMEALKITEETGTPYNLAGSYLNVGRLYAEQGNSEQAFEFYFKARDIQLEHGDSSGLTHSYQSIGGLYIQNEQWDKAKENYLKCFALNKRLGDVRGIAHSTHLMGQYYLETEQLDSAEAYLVEALELNQEIRDMVNVMRTYSELARLEQLKGNCEKAINFGTQAKEIARASNALKVIMNTNGIIYRCYEKLGQPEKALSLFEEFIHIRDSIESESNQKALIRQEYKYDYEKKAAADSIRSLEAEKVKDAEIAQQDAQLEAKRNEQILLFGGLALVLGFAAFIFNRFRVTRKQKFVIEEQKDLVEEKNKEILDSINYAKRLQDAILPAPKVVKEYLAESFILYKPKDIVAGDFYWLEVHEDWSYIAAADCTGHGVPGAMVSVVCSNALTKALVEEGITDTGKLLDRTRQLVIDRFGKSEDEIKDGMDISLAAIRHDGKQVRWSGANNPLWVIKGHHSELRTQNSELLHEVKPDKQPIGKYAKETPFTQHTIDLEKGDTLYMFSDGYIDQFGGEKGKKYKSGKFKKFLLSINDQSVSEQKELLNQEFEKWRGEIEQIDDVVVIGVRV